MAGSPSAQPLVLRLPQPLILPPPDLGGERTTTQRNGTELDQGTQTQEGKMNNGVKIKF